METNPRIDSYQWAGGREAMLRFGPEAGPVVVLALPLFEEANRTRAFGVSILRALAARGIGGVLPELPGQGESEIATVDLRLAQLRNALRAVPGTHHIAMRSGALLAGARPCWMLAPQDGASLLRELARIKGERLDGASVQVAGNIISRDMLADLAAESYPGGAAVRVVRLVRDQRPADRQIDGSPLWRRAEPGDDPVLAQTLAADIADWIAA